MAEAPRTSRQPTMVVVDDDRTQIESIRRSLGSVAPDWRVRQFDDTLEALQALAGDEVAGPFVVLLDLNMPRMNGLEFLRRMRSNDKLHRTPVYVLTSSDDPEDFVSAAAAGIEGYITKNASGDDYADVLSKVAQRHGG